MLAESTRPHCGHSPRRVLVAEDDAEMRRIVTEALRKDGYDVRDVPDGGRLLIAITAQYADPEAEVDLIISDIRMPVCTGIQILESLRKAHRYVPMILMTAFGDDETRAHATRLGAVLFDKPFAVDGLRAMVREVLGVPT